MTQPASTLERTATRMPADPLLSVVMPVFNERNTIEEIIRRVLAIRMRIQLIVVDDVSTDGTTEILERLQKEHGFLLLRQPRNGGKGAALRRGFQAVTGDLVLIQDADLEYSPEEYPLLTELIVAGRADVVYGSRFLRPTSKVAMKSRMANRLLTSLTNILFGGRLTDMETAYKVMRKEALQGLRLRCVGFDIEPELTARLLRAGWRIVEVPISYNPRTADEGKKMRWIDGVDAIYTLLKCRFTP